MKTLDFTQPGRMPVTQDVLDYLQQSNIEMFAAIGKAFVDNNAPTTPVIVSGINRVGSVVMAGYLFYGGEVIQFVQTTIPAVLNGKELAVIINETDSPLSLPFFNGTTPSVKRWKWATLTTQDAGLPATATQFAYAALQPLGAGLGANNKEPVFGTLSLSAFGTTGSMSYRKNYISNTLHVYGSLNVVVSGLSASPNPYYQTGILDVPYRPQRTVPFSCYYRYHNSNILDDTGKDYIRVVSAEIDASGNVNIGLLKAASNYTLTFNTIIPLD